MTGTLVPRKPLPARRFELPLQAQVTSGRIQLHGFLGFSALQLKSDPASKHRRGADQRQDKASRLRRATSPLPGDIRGERGPDNDVAAGDGGF